MKNVTHQPTALERFIHHKDRIDAALARLQAASEDHFGTGPETIHWGHVGDLERLADCGVRGFTFRSISSRVRHG